MNTNDSVVKLAVDAYKGNVTKYSVNDSMDVLRNALIEANNGSTKLDIRAIRDGKCSGLFALIEEIIPRTVVDGLQGDEYFNELVDFRNYKLGDTPVFEVEDDTLFFVSETADGTQGVRRQRLGGGKTLTIDTTMHTVKIYEELNRVLAGRVDFNHMIDKIAASFRQNLLQEIYTLWTSVTTDDLGGDVYNVAGAYDEAELLTLIDHVEAASGGKPATIIGTKTALRNLAPAVQGGLSRDDLYTLGYYGKFYGANVVALPQRHRVNSTEFVFDPNVLTVIAGDSKPIKCVYEGDSLIIPGDPLRNGDLTQEMFYGDKYGMAIATAAGNGGFGRYEITG